jgi:transposase-like protein
MGDRFGRKGAMASQIPKSMRWSYDVNFKFMVIKHAEETNNCATALKFGVAESNVRRWRKKLKRSKFNPKSILWAQAWEFQCH